MHKEEIQSQILLISERLDLLKNSKNLGFSDKNHHINILNQKLKELRQELNLHRPTIGFPPKSINLMENILRFNYRTQEKIHLTFKEVIPGQFFIDSENRLCQRANDDGCMIMTYPDGRPTGYYENYISPDEIIKKILPFVESIDY